MNFKYLYLVLAALFCGSSSWGQEKYGATIPWTTYEAENMKTTGTVLGPRYDPYHVETESSGQKCVKLVSRGQFVEFAATVKANAMVIRYSIPDGRRGGGTTATVSLLKNNNVIGHYKLSSRFSWLYGEYPFVNDPRGGKPRNFYNEIRIKDLSIAKGDVIRIQFGNERDDDAAYCVIDLADLEEIAPALTAPANSLAVTDKAFADNVVSDDYTAAFRKCIAAAALAGKTVWIPAGTYKIAGDLTIPANVTIQGAGMWHSALVGDENQYTDSNKRVRIKGNGSNIHLADFAIIGKLNYRSDHEANDGIVGSYGRNSTISRLWIEHTKVGMWIENSENLMITGCRMRNTMADGINFCVGMRHSTITNCTARGTGDDCFAIWPAAFEQQQFAPGFNVISHCTAELPFLANGSAIYGGESNMIENCYFKDISQGSAVLISSTFPTDNAENGVDNNFSGTTVVRNCEITNSGGFDHEWDWRGAIELCPDRKNISGIRIENVYINNSFSNGLDIVTKAGPDKTRTLSNTSLHNVTIKSYGLAVNGKWPLFISSNVSGDLVIKDSAISTVKNESTAFKVSW